MEIFSRILILFTSRSYVFPNMVENDFMNTTTEKYALFFWHQPQRMDERITSLRALLGGREESDDAFTAPPKSPPKQLIFLKMADTAVELTAQIAKSPTLDYVIMRGKMHNVKASTSVFVDGKNLLEEQLNA